MGKQVKTSDIYLKLQVWMLSRNQWARGIDLGIVLKMVAVETTAGEITKEHTLVKTEES